MGGEYDGYDEYEDSTEKADDHTETPWETVPPEVKIDETENHNDLNGYMRFLNKVQ